MSKEIKFFDLKPEEDINFFDLEPKKKKKKSK